MTVKREQPKYDFSDWEFCAEENALLGKAIHQICAQNMSVFFEENTLIVWKTQAGVPAINVIDLMTDDILYSIDMNEIIGSIETYRNEHLHGTEGIKHIPDIKELAKGFRDIANKLDQL